MMSHLELETEMDSQNERYTWAHFVILNTWARLVILNTEAHYWFSNIGCFHISIVQWAYNDFVYLVGT